MIRAVVLGIAGLGLFLESRVLVRDLLLDNYSRDSVLLQVGRIATASFLLVLALP